MKIARFIISPELRNLLPFNKRGATFDYPFTGPQTIKHLVESIGIPHTETGMILANDKPVRLDYLVKNGDRIEIQNVSPTDPEFATAFEPRFVLDGHLGRLTSHLRMLGLDCLYRNDYDDEELVHTSVEKERTLLTRDRHLLMHKIITQGYLVRSLNSKEQLHEVVKRFSLLRWIRPFQRCIRCNHRLETVSKDAILDRLEPLTKKYFNDFRICPTCQQIYWKGSHYDRMLATIEKMKSGH